MNKEILTVFPSTLDKSGTPDAIHTDALANFALNRRMLALRAMIHLLCRISPRLATEILLFLFLRPRRKAITYTAQLPAGARPITIFHHLRTLKGYEWGSGEKTVLLVHGWESHLGHMLRVVNPLVKAGYRVLAFDAPGHGQSPQLYSNMVDFGEAVRNAVEQHAPIYAIIGNSFGAAATALMLDRHGIDSVERLVLVSPMGHILQHIDIFDRLTNVPDHVMTRVLQRIANHIGMPLGQCDVRKAITNLTMPGLLIHDAFDEVIPVHSSHTLAELWKSGTYIQSVGLGHRGPIQNDQVIGEIVRFLDK